MKRLLRRSSLLFVALTLALLGVFTTACGGGVGGSEGAGRGLVLLSFVQDGVDNAVLNTRLQFNFSEAVDPNTVNSGSIHIREGDQFGNAISGEFFVSGSVVYFEPRLPSRCPPNGGLL